MMGRAYLAVAVVVNATCCWAAMQTTTTTYQYDADGAPTAVTTQVDGQSPSVVYLTWDNFIPNTTDPTTGSVLAGNGNLLGVGPTPGSGFTTQFQYDPRNRLTGAAATGAPGVTYTYHPASLMASSTLSGGDAMQFYYGISPVPQVTNITQSSSGMSSAYLGEMTYLSDGTEQMRCQPRKDVAGLYEPVQQSFTAQRYDPYGAPASGTSSAPQSTYDLHQNPFQYAGEYQDPSWGGYYLRARWYLPQYQTFLGRDVGDAMHRYGYAGGNPVGNVDPTGLRYTYGDFSRSVNRFLSPVNRGLRGELLPLLPVYGQIVGGIQLLGNLPEVWHHPNFKTWASFSFLVASVAMEVGDSFPALDRAYGPLKAFGGRIAADLTIGVGQTALAGTGPHGKLDVPALVQSISYNASGILWGRLAAGFGYRSHPLSVNDVENRLAQHAQWGDDGDALVFKVRQEGATKVTGEFLPTNATFPALDLKRIGMFHEGLLAVSKDTVWFTEVGRNYNDPANTRLVSNVFWQRGGIDDVALADFMEEAQGTREDSQFEFAGRYPKSAVNDAIGEVLPAPNRRLYNQWDRGHGSAPVNFNRYSSNCQDYVARVLASIRGR